MRTLLIGLVASFLFATAMQANDNVIDRSFPEARDDNVAKIKEICQEAILKVMDDNYNPLLVDSEEYYFVFTTTLAELKQLCIVSRGGYGTKFNPIPVDSLAKIHRDRVNAYFFKKIDGLKRRDGAK